MHSYSEVKRYEMKKDSCFSERSVVIAVLLAFAVGIRLGTLYIMHYNGDVINPAIQPTTGLYLSVYFLICVGFSGLCLIPLLIIEGIRKIYYSHRYKRAWKDWRDYPIATVDFLPVGCQTGISCRREVKCRKL